MKKQIIIASLCLMSAFGIYADNTDCLCLTSELNKIPVSSIALDQENIVVKQGANHNIPLDIFVGPENAYYQNVVWTTNDTETDNNKKVTVDDNGNVTVPKNAGAKTVVVTATITDPVSGDTFTKSCTITITNKPIVVTSLLIAESPICVTPGEVVNLYNYITVEPSNATLAQNLTFTPQSYTVNAGKAQVPSSAVGGTSETITVSADGVSTNIELQVLGGKPTKVIVNPITATIYARKHQTQVQLEADVLPKCASHEFTWESLDPTLATVDADGLVTAVDLDNDNTVIIRAKSVADPNVYADCVVNICRKLPYSVSPDTWVEFSSGNLQYNATAGTHGTADGQTLPGTWRIAPNQWDVIGDGNVNVSETYNGWIDLFGWGTSGWDSGSDTYFHPWDKQGEKDEYAILCVDGTFASTQPYYDWGAYNEVQETMNINGVDRTLTHSPNDGSWRTLTRAEWEYLIGVTINDKGQSTTVGTARDRALQLNTMGSIIVNATETIPGLFLLPDDWDWSMIEGLPTSLMWSASGQNGVRDYETYQFTTAEWAILEAEGATFLPAGGRRVGNDDKNNTVDPTPEEVDEKGYYWSSSDFCKNHANALNFTSTFIGIQENHGEYCNRSNGYCVRLVRVVDL